MGMYDEVIIEYQLPNNANEEFPGVWQTKDFDDPCMDLYKIDKDGYLFKSNKGMGALSDKDHIHIFEPFAFTGPAWFINGSLIDGRHKFKDVRIDFEQGKVVDVGRKDCCDSKPSKLTEEEVVESLKKFMEVLGKPLYKDLSTKDLFKVEPLEGEEIEDQGFCSKCGEKIQDVSTLESNKVYHLSGACVGKVIK